MICLAGGTAAGLIAAGAGGRLVMRLLALTSPGAEGALTEAQATIGEITVGGTLGFVVFSGIPAGVLAGALYALTGPLLPRGRAGGLALGAILLVLVGWAFEPLRADNFDFNLVEPDWLSVLSFTVLALSRARSRSRSPRGCPAARRRWSRTPGPCAPGGSCSPWSCSPRCRSSRPRWPTSSAARRGGPPRRPAPPASGLAANRVGRVHLPGCRTTSCGPRRPGTPGPLRRWRR